MHRWLLTDFEQIKKLRSHFIGFGQVKKISSRFTGFGQVKKISSFLAHENFLL